MLALLPQNTTFDLIVNMGWVLGHESFGHMSHIIIYGSQETEASKSQCDRREDEYRKVLLFHSL
jgi:hypothetical protein